MLCVYHIERVKSVDIRKELGVNSIKEKVREMRLRWYRHMQIIDENNEVRAVGDMRVPGNRPRGDQEGDGWMASEGICMHCGSPRRMHRTEHSKNQNFGPLTPSSGKRRRRRRFVFITLTDLTWDACLSCGCIPQTRQPSDNADDVENQ